MIPTTLYQALESWSVFQVNYLFELYESASTEPKFDTTEQEKGEPFPKVIIIIIIISFVLSLFCFKVVIPCLFCGAGLNVHYLNSKRKTNSYSGENGIKRFRAKALGVPFRVLN